MNSKCENYELMEIKWDNGDRTIDPHCKASVTDIAEHPCPANCPKFKVKDQWTAKISCSICGAECPDGDARFQDEWQRKHRLTCPPRKKVCPKCVNPPTLFHAHGESLSEDWASWDFIPPEGWMVDEDLTYLTDGGTLIIRIRKKPGKRAVEQPKAKKCPKCGGTMELRDHIRELEQMRRDPHNPVYGPGLSDYGRRKMLYYHCGCGYEENVLYPDPATNCVTMFEVKQDDKVP